MFPKSIAKFTRDLAPPTGIGEIPCVRLPIRDVVLEGIPYMISAWELEPNEIQTLTSGGTLYLWIQGISHPMVAVTTEEPNL